MARIATEEIPAVISAKPLSLDRIGKLYGRFKRQGLSNYTETGRENTLIPARAAVGFQAISHPGVRKCENRH
jgi:hypothetical protein